MGKIKLGNIEIEETDDINCEYRKKSDTGNGNHFKLPFEDNPDYGWEIQYKDMALRYNLDREARSNGIEDEDEVFQYLIQHYSKEKEQVATDQKRARMKWAKILTPKIRSGFSSKERAALKGRIDRVLDFELWLLQISLDKSEAQESVPADEEMVKSHFKVSEQITEIESRNKPKRSNKTILTKDGCLPTKFGRSCFMCRYSKTIDKNYVHCVKVESKKWVRAQCRHFDLKTIKGDKDLLISLENKFLDRKVATNPGERKKRYKLRVVKKGNNDPFVGRMCFTCEHKGEKYGRNRVSCLIRTELGVDSSIFMVWIYATCDDYVYTNDQARVGKYTKFMKASGAKAGWKRAQ